MITEPLYHPDISHGHSFTNVLLVDKRVADHNVFVESVNSNTFPIAFSVFSSKTELTALLQTYFTHIERLAIAFTTEPTPDIQNYFLDNSPYFTTNDISIPFTSDATQYSENVAHIIHLVNSFHIKNLDFLGCNTLQYDTWTTYYDILTRSTGTIVGASNDTTGNIKYGGNWTLESTSEEIETVYFTSNIQKYQYLLDWVLDGLNMQGMAALKSDGSVFSWGEIEWYKIAPASITSPGSNVVKVFCSISAAAALKSDGTVVTWGNNSAGGDSSSVQSQLTNVTDIVYTYDAFAALKSNGTVVTWGNANTGNGANSSSVQSQLTNVIKLHSTQGAFAALKSDGTVVAWGQGFYGGDVNSASSTYTAYPNGKVDLYNIVKIYGSNNVFLALRSDNAIITWGAGGYGATLDSTIRSQLAAAGNIINVIGGTVTMGVITEEGKIIYWGRSDHTVNFSSTLPQFVNIVSVTRSLWDLAALKSDGTVVMWGPHFTNGLNSTVESQLTNVISIQASLGAFAALKSDGTVVVWGVNFDNYGQNASAVQSQLINVIRLYSNNKAFAALKSDGTVVTWGHHEYSTTPPASVTSAGSNVISIFSTVHIFAALKDNGTLVAWGPANLGGDINWPHSNAAVNNNVIDVFPKSNVVPVNSEYSNAPPGPPPLDQTTISSINASVPTNLTPNSSTGKISITIDAAILTTGTDTEKSQKRTVFLNTLFTNNAGLASSPNKIVMTKEQLLGTESTITKANMVIQTAANVDTPVEIDNLDPDEGLYVYMGNGDFTVFATSAGNLKIKKITEATYDIYENYVDANSSVTTQMLVGESGTFGTFYYVIGGVAVYDTASPSPVPICFPKGTPVTTNQGNIAIEKLIPNIHTIRGKKIVAITKNRPLFTHIVLIEKDAISSNVPSINTHISKEHKLFYKGKMTRALDLVETCTGAKLIPYNGETLYNVLMEQPDHMMINNLICETLHPDNIMAKIYGGNYNYAEQNRICAELSTIIKKNDFSAYNDLCNKYFQIIPIQTSNTRITA